MFEDLFWIIRIVLAVGIAWGGWLCIGYVLFPTRSEKAFDVEHFATYAVLVLLLTTLGGVLHAS